MSFVILACVLVEFVSITAHEFGHWIAGMAYGMNGHLQFLHGKNFAAIVWPGSSNIAISAAGGVLGCLVSAVMFYLTKLFKDRAYKYVITVVCGITLLVNYIYFLHETFTLNETWAVLFSIVGVIITIEIIVKGIKDNVYTKAI